MWEKDLWESDMFLSVFLTTCYKLKSGKKMGLGMTRTFLVYVIKNFAEIVYKLGMCVDKHVFK